MVKSVTGVTLTYSLNINRGINAVQLKCTATSSDTEKYQYSVTSDGEYYSVFCEYAYNYVILKYRQNLRILEQRCISDVFYFITLFYFD